MKFKNMIESRIERNGIWLMNNKADLSQLRGESSCGYNTLASAF